MVVEDWKRQGHGEGKGLSLNLSPAFLFIGLPSSHHSLPTGLETTLCEVSSPLGARSGFRMVNRSFNLGEHPQRGCLGWRKLAGCKGRVGLVGRAWSLRPGRSWKGSIGWEDGKRRAEQTIIPMDSCKRWTIIPLVESQKRRTQNFRSRQWHRQTWLASHTTTTKLQLRHRITITQN